MGTISKNFDWREFEVSDSHPEIKNIIPEAIKPAIAELVNTVLQPLRDIVQKPLHINSGYRGEILNQIVGGVKTSQHTKGEAADVAWVVPAELAMVVKRTGLPYDQMIIYPTFVHISHKRGGEQRGQILYARSYRGVRKEI